MRMRLKASKVLTGNTSGVCSMTSQNIGVKNSVRFDVAALSKSGSSYDAAANHDPDGSSNGTTVTVTR